MTPIDNPAASGEFDQTYASEQWRRSRHPLRRFVKGFYLRRMLSQVQGPCVDFGCGAGQLLERLPPGSAGLEVNPHLIVALRARGLQVLQANASLEDFELKGLEAQRYRSLVIAHVLEHLPDPAAAMRQLMHASARLGIERIVAVVPGAKGFTSDRTHRTFIDRRFVEANWSQPQDGFVLSSLSYFPGPWAWIGRHFVFHEMMLTFDREAR